MVNAADDYHILVDDEVPAPVAPTILKQHQQQQQQQHLRYRNAFVAVLVTLVLVLLICILGLGAFFLWPRSPDVKITSIDFAGIDLDTKSSNGSVLPKVFLDVNLDLDVAVDNPNFWSVSYDFITVYIDYRGDELGSVNSTDGKVPAKSTTNINASLQIEGLEVLSHAADLVSDAAKEKLPLRTIAFFSGNLEVLFLKPHVEARAECNLLVNPTNDTVLESDCNLGSTFVSSQALFKLSSSSWNIKPNSWYVILLEVLICLALLAIVVRILWPLPPDIELEGLELLGITADSKFVGESMIPDVVMDLHLQTKCKIRNRNFFGATYDAVRIYVYYYEYQVAKAEFVGGTIPARGTAHIDGKVDLQGAEIAWNAAQLFSDYAKGALPLSILIEFSGNVGILLLKPPIQGVVQYNMVVDPSTNEIIESSQKLQ